MNPFAIIHKYYDPESELYRILVTHSVLVAKKALDLAVNFQTRNPEAQIDLSFIYEAAMLHDLGIFRCDAPVIFCTGTEPYVRHGVIGRELLEGEGLPRHALVCERHTGAGISREDVLRQALPLPVRDYLPVTIEEKIICLADKFYSKTPHKLFREKKPQRIHEKLGKWGPEVVARFEDLCRVFLPNN
ncbi:MAG: HD domain-containing protein [candidate division KSB1 bacterium]|nr:HD domain-containing protein [candidate division KSB1 bacterium]MDZ7301478.1 HD domain-containing protein [candidate division KSB1 bacterium]MDZ7310880.1 HD domain-containing protein [candidate division KSB1 bacterium]